MINVDVFPTWSVASILSRMCRVVWGGLMRYLSVRVPVVVVPVLKTNVRLGLDSSSAYETAPPPESASEMTSPTLYAPLGRLSFRTLRLVRPTAGGVASWSTTPSQVLRKVIVAGSFGFPESSTLVNVPFPRRSAKGPLPPTICRTPLPPCSAGSGLTVAVK